MLSSFCELFSRDTEHYYPVKLTDSGVMDISQITGSATWKYEILGHPAHNTHLGSVTSAIAKLHADSIFSAHPVFLHSSATRWLPSEVEG